MKKLMIVLGSVFMLSSLSAQSYLYNNPNYYYVDGVKQYWTDDSTSVNIIVKNRNNYNGIVQKLELLFSDSTDQVLARWRGFAIRAFH
jgi:hypothetical protein